MIYEAIISTRDEHGDPHFTPMGYRLEGDDVVLAPFVPSKTLDNLRREPYAVLNITDDVSIMAGCLTGRRQWPAARTMHVTGYRLSDALAHRELRCARLDDDPVRPVFRMRTVHEELHRAPMGFNRAQAAVVEAAILLTRLDWLDPDKVARELGYLQIAVEKTAGARERTAWEWITQAIDTHERHDISGVIAT